MNKTEAYQRALETISRPESYDQAFEIYQGVGEAFALVLAVPFLMLLLMGAIAEDKYGNSLWDHNGYWIVVIFVLLSIAAMIVAFPYLVMHF